MLTITVPKSIRRAVVKDDGGSWIIELDDSAADARGAESANEDGKELKSIPEPAGTPESAAEKDETVDPEKPTDAMIRYARKEVEKARRRWKTKAENHARNAKKSRVILKNHENHEKITHRENVIHAEECMIECLDDSLNNINNNINNIKHTYNQPNTAITQKSVMKNVISRPAEKSRRKEAKQYLMAFLFRLPEEWRSEKVDAAWKCYVDEFHDFQNSQSRPKRPHTKEELEGVLDLLRFAWAAQGEKGLLDTIWLAVETQRRYVWELPKSCRTRLPRRIEEEYSPPLKPPDPDEPELSRDEQIALQKEQVALFRKLGSTKLIKSAEERLKELERIR